MKVIILVVVAVLLIVVFIAIRLFSPKMSPAEKARRKETYLGLRELVYCDSGFLGQFGKLNSENPVLVDAIKNVEEDNAPGAVKNLELDPNRDKLEQDVMYWLILAKAKQKAGDIDGAQKAVLNAFRTENLESRQQLHLWSVLRELGYQPNAKEADDVLGVVVELGWFGETVTISGYANGDARLLTSSGFGVLGEMTRFPNIVTASHALINTAKSVVASAGVTTSRPLPDQGIARFSILTPGGMHVVEAKESEVQKRGHPMYPMYSAMQDLLTNLRLVASRRK